jgi:hypothetical protein
MILGQPDQESGMTDDERAAAGAKLRSFGWVPVTEDRLAKSGFGFLAEEAESEEIEITPEMIEAGADIIWRAFGDVLPYGSELGRTTATEVFEAMQSARHVPTT